MTKILTYVSKQGLFLIEESMKVSVEYNVRKGVKRFIPYAWHVTFSAKEMNKLSCYILKPCCHIFSMMMFFDSLHSTPPNLSIINYRLKEDKGGVT